MDDEATFAIIGGGIAGTVQAICLAREFPSLRIYLFEKEGQLLDGTSGMNPGRPTLGFHYRHLDTATFCLDNTVKFTKFLYNLGCRDIFAKAPQGGVYVLMKGCVQVLGQSVGPVFSPEEIKSVFSEIRAHAIMNYSDDWHYLTHFGKPDEIYRELQRSDYELLLTPYLLRGVDSCYETAEKTFNVPGICSFLRANVAKYTNITVLTGCFVTNTEQVRQSARPCYRITWTDKNVNEVGHMVTQFLTLACWERVGLLKRQLSKHDCQPTYNRLKMLAVVEMKVSQERLAAIRPMFVASGPFCMISPQKLTMTDGDSFVCKCACTLAIRTNLMTVSDNSTLPRDYVRILEGDIPPDEKEKMGSSVLAGSKQFFKCLESATLVDVRFGTVRVPFGSGHQIDIHDSASEHHARNDSGCYQLGDRLFVNEAMKVIYSVHNAEKVVGWVRVDMVGKVPRDIGKQEEGS